MSDQSFHIVLVEDNPADAYLFHKALEEAELGFDLDILEDGAEALSYIGQHGKYAENSLPDLVVLDLNLPKVEGLQVLAAIRDSGRFGKIPVVITTSSNTPGEQSRAELLGIDRFLTKPLSLDGFLQLGHVVKDLLIKNRAKLTR